MFILDDILLSPLKGLTAVARALQNAAEEEAKNEKKDLRRQLNDLYLLLKTGEITEDEFDEREETILDRLDELEEPNA